MRSLLAVIQFELRYQLRSPFFLGALLLFALLHFLALTGTGIHLDLSHQVALNRPAALLQVELLLFILGLLPIVAFVTNAITRDFEHATAPLVFVTPLSARVFVLGRFLGAWSLAALLSLAGLLGSLLGTWAPWLDPLRVAPFAPLPWVYIFLVVLLPSTFVVCALMFSVAALTRSLALTWAGALTFFVAEVSLNLYANSEGRWWAALLDPSARLTVAVETRYWTISELNTRFPLGWLVPNRLLWLTLALLTLLLVLRRFRLELDAGARVQPGSRWRTKLSQHLRPGRRLLQPVSQIRTWLQRFSPRGGGAQFGAQLKLDLACVWQSPLIYLVLALVIISLVGEVQGSVSRLGLETPWYPLTSRMLPLLRYGLLHLMLLLGLWYAAELVQRERTSRVHELIDAAPCPDWLLLLSKTATLCLLVQAMLVVAVLTLVACQAAAGFTRFELGLYLQSALLYHGVYYCMLGILAVVLQALTANKWLGLLLTLGVDLGLLSLESLGLDHPLYSFSLPEAVYSDMNGFGHFAQPLHALLVYWGALCVLLLVVGLLFYPRGLESALRARWRVARARCRAGVGLTAGLAAVTFLGSGSWIFYNTNILNEYRTPYERLQRRAAYEKAYGRFENAPSPSFESIKLALDLFPAERRLVSRGSALLGNHKPVSLQEFVVSVKPRLHVQQLAVAGATLAQADPPQGFYLFRLHAPLAPGATVQLTWELVRQNEGFVAAEPDSELVANGTYLDTLGVMPVPGYDSERRLTDSAERRQFDLPPAPRTPKLGDPAAADKLGFGVDSRSKFEVVFSTSADQLAVAPGVLQQEWRAGGRRYFHYQAETPLLPNLSFCSARYAVARARWQAVALEVYYDPQHPFNVAALLETAQRGLALYSREFAPYPYTYLRIVEYPRYRAAAKFHSGIVPYSEATGFVHDLRPLANTDYGLLHELAHMWWGERITGAQIQGRWLLTENLADYSAMLLFREECPPVFTHRLAQRMLDTYLKGRSQEQEAELPLMYTERQGYLRAKGPLALYALQDRIGQAKVHQALRNFLRDYSFQTSPCPTSSDLVKALRAQAPLEAQPFITDLFERIVLYDLQVDAAQARAVADGYEVTVEVTAKQVAADGGGKETEEPLAAWFDVALWGETDQPLETGTPLYLAPARLHSGKQRLTIRTAQRPALVALDPFHKMIERSAGNNRLNIAFTTKP